jgi:hypothetical protein
LGPTERTKYVAELHTDTEQLLDTTLTAHLDRPLLLELALIVQRPARVQSVTTLAQLYDLATKRLLAEDERSGASDVAAAVVHSLLADLALYLYGKGVDQIELQDAVDYISAPSHGGSEALVQTLASCKLLYDRPHGVSFAHKSIQEYFTAIALRRAIRQHRNAELSLSLLHDPVLTLTVDLMRYVPDTDSLRDTLRQWLVAATKRAREGELRDENDTFLPNVVSILVRLGDGMDRISMLNCNLIDARLERATFVESTLTRCNLAGAELADADFSGAVLCEVNLQNAFLHRTVFRNARLSKCDFWNIRWVEEPASLWCGRWLNPGSLLALGTSLGDIYILAVRSNVGGKGSMEVIEKRRLDASGVLDIATTRAGDRLLASDRHGGFYGFRLLASDTAPRLGHEWTDKTTHSGNIRRIRFSATDGLVATASRDGTIRIFTGASRLPIRQHSRHQAAVMDLAWSPTASIVASTGYDGSVCLYDVDTDETRKLKLSGVRSISRAVAFAPSGKLLAAGDEAGRLSVWETTGADARLISTYQLGDAIFCLDFEHEDKCYVGHWSGALCRVDLSSGRSEIVGRHKEAIRSIDTRRGHRVSVGWDGSVAATGPMESLVEYHLTVDGPGVGALETSVFTGAVIEDPRGLTDRQISGLRALGARVTP